jgi:hypothetical protein
VAAVKSGALSPGFNSIFNGLAMRTKRVACENGLVKHPSMVAVDVHRDEKKKKMATLRGIEPLLPP